MPEVHEAALKLLAKHGVPKNRIRGGLMNPMNPSGLMISLTYFYDLNDTEEVMRAKAINEEWPRVLFQEVLGMKPAMVAPYRPGPDAAKTLMPQLGEYYELLKKLKRWLDPNRIMNPGKLMDIEPY